MAALDIQNAYSRNVSKISENYLERNTMSIWCTFEWTLTKSWVVYNNFKATLGRNELIKT